MPVWCLGLKAFSPAWSREGGRFLQQRTPFRREIGNEPKNLKKDIALAGLFDRLRARFQTDGGTV
jgi:hypothetical protein